MRNLLVAGTAGLFLALGAANAYAVPQSSPYATMVPPDAVDGWTPAPPVYVGAAPVYAAPGYGEEVTAPAMVEGRSAYVENDGPGYVAASPAYVYRPAYAYRPAYVYEDRAYSPFPFSLLPWNW